MSVKVRMNCVEVSVQPDLSIYYRLTLPVKAIHKDLFNPARIKAYIRKNKVRYMYEFESRDRDEIMRHLVQAQSIINETKIVELMQRQNILMNKLQSL
jgi:hypothetical protein